MANQVRIDLSVEDTRGTLAKRTAETKALNKELETTQKLSTGTRTGNRAVAASYSAASESTAYGQARGSMGATGASGRDFANQAQGLGGLVRLYATYAANVFAVSAAFSALRDSMSTDIMIRGLDQLGAASGIAMGSLAKQFTAASGGAISLREAMESTAKAVSSGLSSAQFMELGKVAKGASQALGVNMSDAVSRVTRGITKLEPELLDELGIFTKVGKASEDYARKVGKSVDSLTDFEKRQAFANAVLAEGNKKFGEIAVQSNPYDQLLASLKNTAQNILSAVNSVVAPIAKILADNTGLITAALGLMAVKIVQQALPALASWQKGLASAAAVSAGKLGELVNPEGFVERAQAKFNIPKLEAELARAEAAYAASAKKFVETDNNYKTKGSPLLKTIASGAVIEGNNYVNAVKQVSKATDDLTAADQRHVSGLKETIRTSDALIDVRKRLAAANDLVQASADKPLTAREKAQQSRYKEVAGTSARLNILVNVGKDYDTEGFVSSVKKANAAAKDSGSLSKFGQIVTTVQAAGIAGAKSLALFGGRVLSLIPILGTLYTAYEILDAVFSKNSKEAKVFRDGLDQLSEIAKTNTNVFEKFGNTLSVESLNAKATAFGDLAAAIQKSTSDLQAADLAAGTVDRFFDGVLSVIGKDLKSSYTKTLATSLSEGIKNIPDKGIRDELEKKLKLETGATSTGIKDLKKALDDVSTADIVKKGKALTALVDAANKPLQTSRALSQDIQAAGKATAQAELDLRNSITKTDSVGLYYEKVVKQLDSTKKGFADTTTAAAEFQKIAEGTANINFLGSDGVAQLTNISTEYTRFALSISATSTSLQQNKDKLAAIEQQLQGKLLYTSARNELNREADRLKENILAQSTELNKNKDQIATLAGQAKDLFQNAYTQAFDNAIASAGRKIQLSNLQFAKNVLASSPTQTPESLKQQFDLDKQMIKLKQLEITSQYDLIDALDRAAANQKILDLEKQLQGASRDPVFRQNLLDQLSVEQAKLSLIGGRAGSGEMATLRQMGGAEGLAAINRNSNRNLAVQNAQNELKMLDINFNKNIQDLGFKDLTEALNKQKTATEQQLEAIKLSPEYLAASESERLKQTREQVDQLGQIAAVMQSLPAAQNLAQTKVAGTPGQIQKAEQLLATSQTAALGARDIATQKLDQAAVSAADLENLTQASTLYKEYYADQAKGLDIAKYSLEYKQASLAKDLEQGKLSQDQFNSAKYLLDLEQAGLTRSNALLAEQEKYTATILDIRTKIAEAGGIASPALLQAERDATAATNNATDAINRQYTATKSLLDLNKSLSDRQIAYGDIVKNSFNSMGDAIVDWAQTGKWAGKELFNSLIADLARYEIKLQTMEMYKAFRPSLMGAVSSLFGGNIGTTMTGSESAAEFLAASGGSLFAKGGAFDYGVEAFAQGGTFTNGIVNSPTLFKFAKGTGLMGEAGPEAIMPLKRDSQGNLGVRAGGQSAPSTNVVVNNYGSEQATTKETTDSKGNRRIEVIIGEAVAKEVGRANSPVNMGIRSNFQVQPNLVRR